MATRPPPSSPPPTPSPGYVEYQLLIDELTKYSRTSVQGRWVREGRWNPSEPQMQALVSSLTAGQREVLAKTLDACRQGGVHGTLAVMTDLDLRFVRNGIELPHQPTGSESYYDYVCRLAGDAWPAEDRV